MAPVPPKPKSAPRPHGLTLIELVVTISIIGLIVSVALPAMRDLTVGDTAGPLEPLRVLLVDARQRSAATGSPVRVWVSPTSGRYRLEMDSVGRTVHRDGVLQLPAVRIAAPTDRFTVVFDPVGLGVGDTLAADGVVLRVNASTGAITIER